MRSQSSKDVRKEDVWKEVASWKDLEETEKLSYFENLKTGRLITGNNVMIQLMLVKLLRIFASLRRSALLKPLVWQESNRDTWNCCGDSCLKNGRQVTRKTMKRRQVTRKTIKRNLPRKEQTRQTSTPTGVQSAPSHQRSQSETSATNLGRRTGTCPRGEHVVKSALSRSFLALHFSVCPPCHGPNRVRWNVDQLAIAVAHLR